MIFVKGDFNKVMEEPLFSRMVGQYLVLLGYPFSCIASQESRALRQEVQELKVSLRCHKHSITVSYYLKNKSVVFSHSGTWKVQSI